MAKKRVTCRECGQSPVRVNRNGYCSECAALHYMESVDSLRSRRGEIYEKWKVRYKQGVLSHLERLERGD